MSKENEKDLVDIPEEVRDDLTLHVVDTIDEVLKFALEADSDVGTLETPQIWGPEAGGPDISAVIE